MEKVSEHPLAQPITRAALERRVTPPAVERFQAVPGRGVSAQINGHTVIVGNPAFLNEAGVGLNALKGRIHALESSGHTLIVLACNNQILGLLAITDPLRPDAATTVDVLRRVGIIPVLLTGDNPRGRTGGPRSRY